MAQHQGPPTMRIGIDARIAHYTGGGISEYTIHLAKALAQLSQEDEFVLLQSRKDRRHLVHGPHVHRVSIWTPSHNRFEQQFLRMELPARRLGLDLLHSTDFIPPLQLNTFKSIITVHDLAFLRWPHFLTEDSARYYGQVDQAVKRADHIIAVSQSTRDDLIGMLGAPPEKITVVYEAADPVYRPIAREEALASYKDKHLLPEEFILFVSTIEPRKNIVTLLRAYALLRERYGVTAGLVLAGGVGWQSDQIFEEVELLELGEYVTFLGRVNNGDLLYLYNLARCLAHPALYEGFGLTPLEAMASGTPVVVSNVSSLPEVVGDAGLLVDPNNVEELAVALHRLLMDDALHASLRAKGLARAQVFSWQRAAQETMDIYQRALGAG
ncbi:MAG: glycosyltransferase family 4 protein [Anaerolineae bacterium]|nr:glycosyltransferase family 4 protein [Anaerolineae bacterium]